LLKQAHAFTVNTPYLESLFNIVNINQIPCYILPVGLDTDVFSKQLSEKDKRYFDLVFCGKLIPLKGPDFAIEIVKRLHDNGYTQVRLHIIGKGILSKTLKKQVENYQLQENIIFYGAQTQVELKQHFEQADAFIFPGRHEEDTGRAETQGLVIQEAQAMKLPVIVSDAGGMKYKLKMGQVGRLFVEKKYKNNILIEHLLTIYDTITEKK
jgi:colanic acid/amylovoran biosynthesis glycosyltransferase